MRLRYSFTTVISLLMLISSIGMSAACGKKGPLYHPTATKQVADKDKAKKQPLAPTPPSQ